MNQNEVRYGEASESKRLPPVVCIPVKACIEQFMYGLHNQEPGTVIKMQDCNVLSLALLGRATDAETWSNAQESEYLCKRQGVLKVAFPDHSKFYLNNSSIIQINAFLDQWFTAFCVSVIITNKTVGVEERVTIDLLLQQYNIDTIALDAMIKRSQRFRKKLHTAFYLRKRRR
jgi:hypothetical protein